MSVSPRGPTTSVEGEPSEAHPQPEKKAKRFQCHRCQRLFARLEHLQRHERTHTQEKPFACQQCDQRFSRSDLLVRHERLNHDPNRPFSHTSKFRLNHHKRRKTVDNEATLLTPTFDTYGGGGTIQQQPTPTSITNNQDLPFATLLMAAEQAHPQPTLTYPPSKPPLPPPPSSQAPSHQFMDNTMPSQQYVGSAYDLEDSLQDLAAFMDNGPMSTYQFSSFINSEQPIPFFSPDSFGQVAEILQSTEQQEPGSIEGRNQEATDDQGSFSNFGSRLPSLQPDEQAGEKKHNARTGTKSLGDVTPEDRQILLNKLAEFDSVVSSTFQLPSRLALSRYITGYINGFQEHMPFLHIPTMTVESSCVELVLAMAAVGAQYCFEGEKGVELFHVSRSVAYHRIRQRDARLAAFHKTAESQFLSGGVNRCRSRGEDPPRSMSVSGHLGLPLQSDGAETLLPKDDLIQTAQALFILMAMATWAKHREILREALAIQSVLATLVRDGGLSRTSVPEDVGWEAWARQESCKRTKFLVYCFFNLHCIVYNIPSLILSSELDMTLPCNAVEFKAESEVKWREARSRSTPAEVTFQSALTRLFSRGNGSEVSACNSSLGNYILVHAIIQHIFFVRQVSRYRLHSQGEIPTDDVTAIEQALKNWQVAWKRNPESSLDPHNPNGPITFNSTALLRLGYIRLNVDIGPGRSLDTRDPTQIARAFSESPPLKRTPKLLRAVLHSAHALSIPVKIGIHLVAQTQTFNWSIQHSLCTLECAFTLSKWLEALSLSDLAMSMTTDERKIASLVKTMLDETEFAVPSDVPFESQAGMKYLSANVLRVWAKVFRGAQTWAVVDIIGTSLSIYADLLEAS